MIVLDSYAVLALLKGEPAAIKVQHLVENEEDALLTSLGVAEVLDHLVRLADAEEDEAVLDLAQLGLRSPAAVEADLSARAGLLLLATITARTEPSAWPTAWRPKPHYNWTVGSLRQIRTYSVCAATNALTLFRCRTAHHASGRPDHRESVTVPEMISYLCGCG